MYKSLGLLLATLALAGCSSSEPSSGGPGQPGGTKLSLDEVATEVGCTGMTQGEVQIYTEEAAECTKDGHDVYLYTFATKKNRDQWMKVARDAGGPGKFLNGPLWVAQIL